MRLYPLIESLRSPNDEIGSSSGLVRWKRCFRHPSKAG